jgi:hypothetical protein
LSSGYRISKDIPDNLLKFRHKTESPQNTLPAAKVEQSGANDRHKRFSTSNATPPLAKIQLQSISSFRSILLLLWQNLLENPTEWHQQQQH